MPLKQTRIRELDGIRGCAILLVLIWHYIACQLHSPPLDSINYILARSLSLTKSGVDMFFVLSGFLIAGILLDNREANNYFRVFYLRRICRIFPLYFLMLGLFLVLTTLGLDQSPRFHWLFQNPFPLWSYATFTQNILVGLRGDFGANWLGITWSLAVEEQFYCFIPLLVWLLPRRKFALVALSLIFLAPLLRSVSRRNDGLPAYVWTPGEVTPCLRVRPRSCRSRRQDSELTASEYSDTLRCFYWLSQWSSNLKSQTRKVWGIGSYLVVFSVWGFPSSSHCRFRHIYCENGAKPSVGMAWNDVLWTLHVSSSGQRYDTRVAGKWCSFVELCI